MLTVLRQWNAFFIAVALLMSAPAVAQEKVTAGPVRDSHPSFSCRPGLDVIETAICGDEKLAVVDIQLDATYHSILKQSTSGQQSDFVASQRDWLKRRSGMCQGQGALLPDCIRESYVAQIADLKAHAAQLGVYPQLTAGRAAALNIVTMHCGTRSVTLTFPEDPDSGVSTEPTRTLEVADESGLLHTSLADCLLQDGTSVRIKAGYKYSDSDMGTCGGAPALHLSAWVNKRQVLSRVEYATGCWRTLLSSATVSRLGATLCLSKTGIERSAELDGSTPSQHRTCRFVPSNDALLADREEYPVDPHHVAPVGSLVLHANGGLAALCATMMPAVIDLPPALPSSALEPVWTDVDPVPKAPNVSALGYNATTLAAMQSLKMATFDLFNSGRPVKIFYASSFDNWFNGSALAMDRDGVVTMPFDAHDWDASVLKGIYPFTYAYIQAFFFEGKTYLFMSPVNKEEAASVISLHEHGATEEECTFDRVPEHF